MLRTTLLTAIAATTLAGCATTGAGMAGDKTMRTATAPLRTATGADVGTVTATEMAGGIQIRIDARGMPAGMHGAHVHTTGRCDAPDFTTAGGHWNPTAKQHGTSNPAGPHAGDAPNLTIGADGTGSVTIMLPAGTMDGLLDADGSAFVIHAQADDYKTDPSGNSGGRIACGVFAAA
ncbi:MULTISPECIES: superoxide dismutase family protein [unclassified Sphingomonas]|uniref:superoxide dismutase family protein n=1 Tax=unclassified Sphingomonas TaxID=196159 RepID=UPI0006F5A570|nr:MULTISPECIES: superoxide dismutase family protein [unclassified Sphingomonas]KQM58866.1 superoxide dismutase [Sphingomonas sp. Leaf16]KQN11121.1 superoxide dismutase [Sphingomonas sp. Leaf29]KQN18420.1 superoxide dismutase [Sphingomonas sp. Leaf32]